MKENSKNESGRAGAKERTRTRRKARVYHIIIWLSIAVLLGAGVYFAWSSITAAHEATEQAAGDGSSGVPDSDESGTDSPDAAGDSGSMADVSDADAGNTASSGNGGSAIGDTDAPGGPESGADAQGDPVAGPSADEILEEASILAAGYDYDAAISLLRDAPSYGSDERLADAVAEYESVKQTLQPVDISEVTHVFFHSLVIDESKAFDGDAEESGYNQVMTTRDEFLKILDSMYEKGFVLVRMHDMAVVKNGKMTSQEILLPPGKKACVMSQDDVCYYEYMEDDGFARRMVIGDDGKPACEMVMDDGTISVGSYDLVPILEDFIQEHPDFSYKGARAVIAFTGYQGILGYRTAASYRETNPDYEADCRAASAVAQCLRDNGWELASHSWGHRDLGNISYDRFKADCDKWEAEVEPLIGPTDIILFPFGADVSDWHPYTRDNERFMYLKSLGFDYFCNVYSAQYWVQLDDDFLRQGRRNLDGYRMWMDIAAGEDGDRKLDDLFRAEDVFSPNRPTPVIWE